MSKRFNLSRRGLLRAAPTAALVAGCGKDGKTTDPGTAAAVADVDPTRGPAFSHSHLVCQAAADGQGVALGRGALVAQDLAAGRLVKPFDISLAADYAYYVVTPTAAVAQPKITAFRDWLLEEARRDPAAAA